MCISQNIAKRRPLPFAPSVAPLKNHVIGSSIVAKNIKPELESFWAGTKKGGFSKSKTSDDQHHIVVHDYHDHSNDKAHPNSNGEDSTPPKIVARGGVTTPFPVKLHEMLVKIESDGYASVVSWQPHGRCFVVHKPKEFVDDIMPKYFKQSKFASFQRQLNLYGFVRLTRGQDKGGYYHEMFLRGKHFLAQRIQRMKVKGTGVRARSNPDTEPNFYAMPPVCCSTDTESTASTSVESNDETVTKEISPRKMPLQEQAISPAVIASTPINVPSAPMNVPLPIPLVAEIASVPIPPVVPTPSPTQLPNQPEVNMMEEDNEDVVLFEGKPFHYLDPFAPESVDQLSTESLSSMAIPTSSSYSVVSDDSDTDSEDPFSRDEMEDFLHDLNLPKDLYQDIVKTVDDDAGFGYLLEKIIE
mmetsp:Transcript_6770/g.8233  ORF Transcript_6770/g.8233 Transcript_6770/m.8233 type:complete len:414 (-) Transcript_6770:144-1385(-)|eukprot:CAMPEP_0195292132 /NCGR_PEP_ID=MMETSP0707-20130614/8632_1 /TAXON_ID=33640 /ORGANISM="Asterionellopsis glacialis, Strain CCMP134" /LENGTH=413 /DNA_ID=CAMNT_0040352529 /DNA_START=54 /DNA_END=1295 /DNA_ORIENTATION=+